MARAFVAKAVYDLPSTRALLVGWPPMWPCAGSAAGSGSSRCRASRFRAPLPSSPTHAPARARSADPGDAPRPAGATSRATIEAREKPATKEKPPPPPKRKRGRPKKGEDGQRPRLERQPTTCRLLDDLPTACDVGTNSKGDHLGRLQAHHVADGQIPISCLLTSASLPATPFRWRLCPPSGRPIGPDGRRLRRGADPGAQPLTRPRPVGDVNPRGDKARAEELRTEARA